MILEFGPVILFFAGFYISGSFPIAVLALGSGTILSMIASRIINKRRPLFALFSGGVTIVTSFFTYYLNNPDILIIKDSVMYIGAAIVLSAGIWSGKHFYRMFFHHIFALTDHGWLILERRWAIFFGTAGILNEYVRVMLTIDQWVLYKGYFTIFLVIFGFYQLRMMSQNRLPNSTKIGLHL